MDAADAVAAKLARAQPLRLGPRRRVAIVVSEPSTSGQTTYAWRPSSRWRAEPRVRLGAPLLASPTRVTTGLRFGGRRRDLGDGEVAVHRQRERPRDRRRGHVEHVRAPALGERRALLDAEAVLLVDDRDREVGELDLALDQRVRADCDPDVARGDELVRLPVARAR